MEIDNIAIRLKLFIEAEGLSYSQFADMCGIPRPSLSQIMSGRNKKVSDVIVGMIHRTFPELSVVWLLFGEGPMKNSAATSSVDSQDFGIFTDEDSLFAQKPILTPVKETSAASQSTDNRRDSLSAKQFEKPETTPQPAPAPRKVVQITVYYDDSTFETFYPSGKK